jgi:hypothetical protein
MVNGCLTVIEIVAVVVPPGPVAVSVYVESTVGETTKLPDVMVVPECATTRLGRVRSAHVAGQTAPGPGRTLNACVADAEPVFATWTTIVGVAPAGMQFGAVQTMLLPPPAIVSGAPSVPGLADHVNESASPCGSCADT